MLIYDRSEKKMINEVECSEKLIGWLYGTRLGRTALKIVTSTNFNKLIGVYYNSRISRHKIPKAERKRYESFNAYFSRSNKVSNFAYMEKLGILGNSRRSLMVPSIAEAKLSMYKIGDDRIRIKNSEYTISDLVEQKVDDKYRGGICLVFRLSITDYHRYSSIDKCRVIGQYMIPGKLHTVRSISSEYNVYTRNTRFVQKLIGDSIGEFYQIAVGALTVGKIVPREKMQFGKCEEMGHFELGGSTVVLLIQPGKIEIDEDIRDILESGVEVRVNLGERIGVVII